MSPLLTPLGFRWRLYKRVQPLEARSPVVRDWRLGEVPVVLRHLPAAAAVVLLGSGLLPISAHAGVDVRIDKSAQRMTVSVDGHARYSWPISTGRAGYGTPNGHYRPQRMMRTYFSRKYYNSPMPYSIFFHGGFAIHGTHEISRIGGPASHGCVRLTPGHAAKLFALVKQEGPSHTRITVTGSAPFVAYRHRRSRPAVAYDDDRPVRYARPYYRYRFDGYDRPVNYGAYGPPRVYYYYPYSRDWDDD
jgi:hypothetical protein